MTSDRPIVVVAIKGLGIGGAEKLIVEGSRFWNRSRFDYRVAYALPWKDQLVEALRSSDVPVECFGSRHGMTPAAILRFRKLCKTWNASLVHAHLPSMGAVARVTSSVPVVYTEHNIASSYRRPVQLANRATYSLNASVIAVSDAVFESISSYPAPRRRVIPNGVHVQGPTDEAGVRAELGLGVDDHLVVHVGNIRPKKGHRTLLAAARVLLAQRDDVQIVSVGAEKSPGDLEELRKAAADLGIAERMRFLGRREDAMRFIGAADVYVNPADVEGLPVTILEALALERPVVATSVGGVPSIIEEGVTGLLVPPSDPDALAAALLQLLDDPSMAGALGKRGRDLVESEYGLEAMIRATEAEYLDVLGG
jgi:glycosyltransferase involved in cell wall biosynthesis